MNMIIEYFSGPLGQIELLATILILANVYLLAKQKLINYWFGLAGVLLFGYLFREIQLYSDMLLQWVFYAPLQILGFIMWKYGRTLGDEREIFEKNSMLVVTISWSGRAFWAAMILSSAYALGSYMSANTDASFPYIDALTTTMSIVASILMLKKVLENWMIWIAMDIIAIPVYYMKGMVVTSGLYVILLGLASYGLYTWYKDMTKMEA